MVHEKDICLLSALLHEAGCSDVALAMEMALYSNEPTLDEIIHDFTAEASASSNSNMGAAGSVVFGTLGLDVPRINDQQKSQYRVLASKLLGNSDASVREAAQNLLKAVR